MSLDWQELVPLIAHDARAFVRKGITHAQLLERQLEPEVNSATAVHLRTIIDSQLDLNRFLSRLVALAEAQDDNVVGDILDLNAIVLGAKLECKEAIAKAGGELIVGEMPSCRVPKRTQIVLKELLDNSVRFAHAERPLQIRVEAEATDKLIRVSVIDTGTGIDEEYTEKLFQPMKRLDSVRSGQGLGLSIAKAIIDACGGRIYHEQANPGASFTFEVPADL
ncbi:MAG: cph1 4 [Bryobacterales bacterium]|nr:cph1 4 [Bryobacterales bacterium]